jgi:hypothetical protein
MCTDLAQPTSTKRLRVKNPSHWAVRTSALEPIIVGGGTGRERGIVPLPEPTVSHPTVGIVNEGLGRLELRQA